MDVTKTVKVAFIERKKTRKHVLKRKIKSLVKKAHDLALLCSLAVCLIFFNREEDKLVVWPSLHEAKSLIAKFLSLPDWEKISKSLDIKTYLTMKIKQTERKMEASKMVIEELECDHLMFQLQCGRALGDLSDTEVNKLISYSRNKIMCLREKIGSMEHPNASVGNEIPRLFDEPKVQNPSCDETTTHLPKKVPQPFNLNKEPFDEENEKNFKGESSKFGGENNA